MKIFNVKLSLAALLFSGLLTGCNPVDPALKQVNQQIAAAQIDKLQNDWRSSLTKPEQVTFTQGANYFWQLETSHGKVLIKLFADLAPMHVTSTIYLTELGFYDGLTFHRIIPGFMAQGGDPLGNGRGNPGYKYQGEFSDKVSHDKAGILSMANAGPGTDGSQFFITFKATPWLNGRHTIFGEVVEGLEVLAQMESLGSRSGQPSETVSIITATIRVD
jgi:cyclophilin family peptidyl-prolyl cis-trans isomerase